MQKKQQISVYYWVKVLEFVAEKSEQPLTGFPETKKFTLSLKSCDVEEKYVCNQLNVRES